MVAVARATLSQAGSLGLSHEIHMSEVRWAAWTLYCRAK